MNKSTLKLAALLLLGLLTLAGLVVGTLDAFGMFTWYRVLFVTIDVAVVVFVAYMLGESKE